MTDAINPSHYKAGWSDDAELISVTENLTGNGAQAVQYVARSTRLDKTLNKNATIDGQVEDLKKAIWFIQREIRRLTKGSEQKIYAGGGLVGGYTQGGSTYLYDVGSPGCSISIKTPQDKQGKPVVDRELLKKMNEETVGISTFNTEKRANQVDPNRYSIAAMRRNVGRA